MSNAAIDDTHLLSYGKSYINSDLEIIEKATKIVAAIEQHFSDGCEHCEKLLMEVYKVDGK